LSGRGYKHSFELLGYELENIRQHWSAANETGVCLSLWSEEWRRDKGIPFMDSLVDCGPIETWNAVGKNKRHEHLKLARDNFDGWIDVVIRHGHPDDEGVPSSPWFVSKRKNYKWRLQGFDENTGHFSVRAEHFKE